MSWSWSSGTYFWPSWFQMPYWRNMPSMPKVRLSSGTIGTMWRPICLSFRSVFMMRTTAIVVDSSRPSPEAFNSAAKASSAGTASGAADRLDVHLLLLVADVHRLARLAHAEALDGLGEDQRGLALVLVGGLVGGEDLEEVMAAAVQLPHLVVGPVGHQRAQLGRVEEVLAHVGAVLGLEG